MTTVPDWELHGRDSHPLAQRLASLRHFLAVYASLPPVARRKARLATGPPAAALAGLDFHQLDSFERFHPLTWNPPLPSFAWRDEKLILGYCKARPDHRKRLPRSAQLEGRRPRRPGQRYRSNMPIFGDSFCVVERHWKRSHARIPRRAASNAR